MIQNEIIFLFQQQLQWKVTELGVLIYDYDCCKILYTSIAPVWVKVYKLVCQTGFCTVKWNGQMESIFRIPTKNCAVYEILWEFQEVVRRIRCNFAAYCLVVTARYRDRNAVSQPADVTQNIQKVVFLLGFSLADWIQGSMSLVWWISESSCGWWDKNWYFYAEGQHCTDRVYE